MSEGYEDLSAKVADLGAKRAENNGRAANEPDSQLAVIRLSTVEPTRVEWLWASRIPRGKVTILDGDPGLGKSTMTIDLAARITTGSPMPTGERLERAQDVVLVSAEDGVADTIRPRLEAAGGDAARTHILDHVSDTKGPRPFEIPGDLAALERFIADHALDVGLVVIDPFMAFLAGEVKANLDQDVRRAMHPLKELAERTGIAFLVVRHLNKATGSDTLHRGGGSMGIIGAARAGLVVAKDPEDESRRVVGVTKSNLCKEAESLAYRVMTDELYDVGRIQWDGSSALSATDLLRGRQDLGPELQEAVDFLKDALALAPKTAKDLQADAKDQDISPATLRRAAAHLRVVKDKTSGQQHGAWYWSLQGA